MSPPNLQIKDVFLNAVGINDPGERAAFLAEACAGDPELRRRVEALLAAHERPESLLDRAAGAPVEGGTLPHPNAAPLEGPGTRVGPYLLLEPLGEGGMGSVFLAEQSEPVRRRVALKLIKPGMDTRQVIARFEAERQALALMDHPNIARVHDAGATPAGRPYFVMERVDGLPITRYCDDRRLSPRQRLELFIPVCQALQHAHQKGIIHRDLKPSNVLVTEVDGRPVPKVIDFGVAKAIDPGLTGRVTVTHAGALVGTPEYMSPEQAGASPDIDTRTDVYGLGVLLYELLTGTTPIDRASLTRAALDEVLRRVREEEPPRPSTRLSATGEVLPSVAAVRGTEPARLAKLVRGDLDWIVMKALEKDRGRRYETATALARDIQRYLDGDPVEASPPSRAYRLRRFARKHQAGLATATLIALVLVAATAVSTWQAFRARSAERSARSQGDRAREAEGRANRERDAALAAKSQTEELAAITRAVNEFFLADLLGQADPARQAQTGPGANQGITVRELLDRAAARIPEKFADQPDTEIAIRHTIADCYRALGLLRLAVPHIERAVELKRRALGVDDRRTLAARGNLAELYRELGELNLAERLFLDTLAAQRRVLPAGHPDTLRTVGNLALLYQDQGNLAEAEPLLSDNLNAFRRQLGREDPTTLIAQNNLAALYWRQGRPLDAEPLLRETLDARRRTLDPDHPELIISRNNLATLYRTLGRLADAEPLQRDAARAAVRVLGPSHPNTLGFQNNLAATYEKLGRAADAEREYRAALAAARGAHGEDHPVTKLLRKNLAKLLRDTRRAAEADELAPAIDPPMPDGPDAFAR